MKVVSYENEIQNQLKIENYFGTVFFSTSLKTCQCRSKNVENVICVAKKLLLITATYSLGGLKVFVGGSEIFILVGELYR